MIYIVRNNQQFGPYEPQVLKSYIEDGNQKVEEGVYGKSITDPCLGWEKTERLVMEIASLR